MDNNKWLSHIAQWQRFLDELLVKAETKGDEIKLQRQRQILEDTRYAGVNNPKLLIEFINPSANPVLDSTNIDFTLALNDSQKQAVNMAISDNVLSLIQGPPGTGKTQVITEICLQLYKSNPNVRILVCSETHIAVNNLISRLSKASEDIRIVRIRDKEQDESVDEFSPEAIMTLYTDWLKNNLVDQDLATMLSDTLSNYDDISLEKALTLSANVTGMTCNRVGAYNYKIPNEYFDVVIIDEVCKATLPEILMPLSVAKKAIFVGDPKQLPPVFCSEELDIIKSIENCSLQNYMYIDKLFSDSNCVVQLDTQYRMSERISTLISSLFYNNHLHNGKQDGENGIVEWIDYQPSQSWPPKSDEDKQKIYNCDECKLITELLVDLDIQVNQGKTIAIIAPYRSQVYTIRQQVRDMYFDYIEVYVDTVDGFQGKESDIVIFSLTRTHGSYRFLADERRLNVALSRAKEAIHMVGSLQFAESNKLLKEIASRCDKTHIDIGEDSVSKIYNV